MDTLRTLIDCQVGPKERAQIVWATIALSVLCTLDQFTRGPSLTALVIQTYFS